MLGKDEIQQFYKIQKQFESQWKAVVQGVEKQKM
jgi:hypothetical protein